MALKIKKKSKNKKYSAAYCELKNIWYQAILCCQKPNITEQQIKDAAQFYCLLLKDSNKVDFFYLAALDEFFIYIIKKSNFKNDTMAENLDGISWYELV